MTLSIIRTGILNNLTIISGGQSGVDRAALDFALQNKIAYSGWCPKGRLAEDGRIDKKYPLKETSSSIYAERTRLNVEDSDGTIIIYVDELTGGSQYTAEYASLRKKPFMLVNVSDHNSNSLIYSWIRKNNIEVLNIAGPRESSSPGIYKLSLNFLEKVLKAVTAH